MPEVSIDEQTVVRVADLAAHGSPEGYRQLLGLRLLRTLGDLSELVVPDQVALASIQPLTDNPMSDPRYGWPLRRIPDLVEIAWPAPRLSEGILDDGNLRVSPWALHSLLMGEWAAPLPETSLRLPKCVALIFCDGLAENPAGRDLLRLTGQLEVLSFPTNLHSQLLVCGLADGVGKIELEIQVLGPDRSEVGFAIKSVFCDSQSVATFYVASLDQLEVRAAGQYWFILRLLGDELSRLPVEVGEYGSFESGGWEFGQSWTWESDAFFGERQ